MPFEDSVADVVKQVLQINLGQITVAGVALYCVKYIAGRLGFTKK